MFTSVTALPLFRVTVAAPLSYEPPAIPIFAELRVSETSVNTGAPDGKDAPIETLLFKPLTEIVAVVGLARLACGAPLRPTDAVRPPGTEVGLFAGACFGVVAHELPVVDVASDPQAVAICCLKGSLLLNRLNETSCPAFGGRGVVGSRTPSVDVAPEDGADAVAPLEAVEEPASEGGASGWVPDPVVVLDGVLDDAL